MHEKYQVKKFHLKKNEIINFQAGLQFRIFVKIKLSEHA
jgi:hypothetical protein